MSAENKLMKLLINLKYTYIESKKYAPKTKKNSKYAFICKVKMSKLALLKHKKY